MLIVSKKETLSIFPKRFLSVFNTNVAFISRRVPCEGRAGGGPAMCGSVRCARMRITDKKGIFLCVIHESACCI